LTFSRLSDDVGYDPENIQSEQEASCSCVALLDSSFAEQAYADRSKYFAAVATSRQHIHPQR
jgi:hypothetical protein